jgi:hypothetical protein
MTYKLWLMAGRPYVLIFKSLVEINGSYNFEIRTRIVCEPISNEPGPVWVWFKLISNYFESNFLRTFSNQTRIQSRTTNILCSPMQVPYSLLLLDGAAVWCREKIRNGRVLKTVPPWPNTVRTARHDKDTARYCSRAVP